MENLKIFTDQLIQKFKRNIFQLREVKSLDPKLPPIYCYIFENYPDKGLTTFVTHGLSEATHPKWHFGRPELILSVESASETWGIALSALVNRFRGDKVFSNGSTYMLDVPIVEESAMSGFVIFMPSFVSSEDSIFKLPGKIVFLSQAYPIYPNEALMIEKLGFESFWSNKDFKDPYDIHRKDVSILMA